MSIKVESNGIQEAAVTPDLAKTEVVETKESAPVDETSETAEESEASDDGESQDSDADETESQDEESQQAKDDDRPKKKNGFKKRIDKLNRRNSEIQKEVEYWKQEALKRQGNQEEKPKVEAKVETDLTGKPNPDDFDSHSDYVERLTDWKIEQREMAKETKARETQVKTEYQKQVESHVTRVQSFKDAHDDFDDVLESVDDVPMSLTVQEVIIGSENGPELMYELAKNRKELERICKLPAISAARELGRFEARLNAKSESAKEETKPVKKTSAPQPITPVGSKAGGSTRKSIYDPNLPQAEYERLRAEQMRKRYG